MINVISLVTIWTDNIEEMKLFYNQVLGFEIINDLGDYVEFKNEGVRFAICLRCVMYDYSKVYKIKSVGQGFELAFPCENKKELDESFETIIEKGATSIHLPENMPWNQRTALFSDPDGNIHELFCEL
jgi:lactoylglutathione lyase